MNPLCAVLLVATLFLSGSALTPEECRPLLEPQSMADVSEFYGRWNFYMGFIKNNVFQAILGITESSWMNVTLSDNQTFSTHEEKLNGTCRATRVEVTFHGNTARVSIPNIVSTFQLIPGCDRCMVMNINSTASRLDKLVQHLSLDVSATEEEVHIPALYLMVRDMTLTDSDLERFKQQASCLGFSGEPQFHYDPKNGFCAEGEGVLTKF